MNIGTEELVALGAAVFALLAVLVLLARVRAERGAAVARLALVGRAANDLIYEWHIPSKVLTLNASVTTQLGYDVSAAKLARSWWEERLHPEDAGPVKDALATLLKSQAREWEIEYRFRKADGTFTTVHDHGYLERTGRRKRPVRMVGTLLNVDSVSLYDPITGLAGRALFTDRVERRAVRGAISGEGFAVIVVDIEEFRTLSARLGQARADQTLLELSRRFETHVGDGETVARVAHDQLGFLVNAKTADDAVARAAQIRDSARIPFGDAQEIRLDVVAGAAVLPQGGAPDLLRNAFAGLADAKLTKRRIAVYEPGGEKRWDERLRLRDDLAGALERRELELHYQPIADAATGRCVALEALVRWNHPTLGMLDAGELLQIASDLDLGPAIDRWVLSEAARAIGKLRQTRADLGLSVNIAVKSLEEELPMSLRAVFAGRHLPADALTIELPEDPALASGPAAAVLAELRALGVGIAIDDLGTGYASLMPTAAIPATVVKIDRVFAARVVGDEHAARIVRLAVERAHELGLRVVGEGVEDDATVEQLRAMGVDLVQGRGVAAPMSLAAVTRWLTPAAGAMSRTPGAAEAAAQIAAGRPLMIGENEASLATAVNISTSSWLEAGASPAPAQPFGPDPMGWVLPEAGVATAPVVLTVEAAPPEPTPISVLTPQDPVAVPQAWSTAVEPSLDEMRATAFAPAFVPEAPELVTPEPVEVPYQAVVTPAPVERRAPAPRLGAFRTLRQRELEKAAKVGAASEHPAKIEATPEPVPAPEHLPEPIDLRIIALGSAGRTWELRRASGDEESDRVDQRLVLLREYANSQRLGSIAS